MFQLRNILIIKMKRNSLTILAILIIANIVGILSSEGQDTDTYPVQCAEVIDTAWFNRVDSTLRDYDRTDPPLKIMRDSYRMLSYVYMNDSCCSHNDENVDVKKTLIIYTAFLEYPFDDHYYVPFNGRKYLISKNQSHGLVRPRRKYIRNPKCYRIHFFDMHPVCIVQDSIGRMSILSDTTDMYMRIME